MIATICDKVDNTFIVGVAEGKKEKNLIVSTTCDNVDNTFVGGVV